MNLTPDDNGHVLLSAWSEYEKARKADRPQKEAEILQGIRTEAMQKHLPADFYDAGRLYIETVQRRNWKDRDPARTEFERLVRQFDEPIVTYTWMGEFGGKSSDERWEFVRNAADAFGKASHPEFHRGLGSYLGGAIKEFIASDREYVLWDLLRHRELSSWADPGKDEVYAALKAEIGERYPAWPALRYYTASRLPEKERKAAFEQLSADPSMGAVGLWPKGDLLEMRFSELFRNDGKSDDYQKLFSDCEAWLKEKGRLSGGFLRGTGVPVFLQADPIDARQLFLRKFGILHRLQILQNLTENLSDLPHMCRNIMIQVILHTCHTRCACKRMSVIGKSTGEHMIVKIRSNVL